MAMTNKPTHLSASDEELKLETDVAEATGVFSPAGWWRIGLVVLLIVVVALFAGQYFGGNTATAVVPGTPVAAPQNASGQ